MTFKTDTLRRLAEVIIAMKMESIYYEEGFFILPKEKLVIYEELENCSQLKQKLSDHNFVKIHKNGNLTYDTDNEEVRIKFCKNCNKFYFSRKLINVKESCTWCKSSSVKLLSNNGRIPGWYGKNETTLLDYKSALTRLDNYTGDVQVEIKRILEKLSGKPKVITLTPLKIEKIKQLAEEYPNM